MFFNDQVTDAPSGATGANRKTSFTSAETKGKFDSSSDEGILSLPTTLSTSAWARACTAGYIVMNKMNEKCENIIGAYPLTDFLNNSL